MSKIEVNELAEYTPGNGVLVSGVLLKNGGVVDNSKIYNVRNYGAKGDGTTDDASAVQAAIDAAGTAGGGIVFFPPGNYLINSSPRSDENALKIMGDGITLRGAGKDITKITQGVGAFGLHQNYGPPNYVSRPLLMINDDLNSYYIYNKSTYPFATAAKGAQTVTLSTASDAAHFSAGDVIFLWGGRPTGNSDLAWGEQNIVVSSNLSTGVIALRYALSKPIDGTLTNAGAVNGTAFTLHDLAIEDITFVVGNWLAAVAVMNMRWTNVRVEVVDLSSNGVKHLTMLNSLRFFEIDRCEFHFPVTDNSLYLNTSCMEFGTSCGDVHIHHSYYLCETPRGAVNIGNEGGYNFTFENNRVDYSGSTSGEVYDVAVSAGAGWNSRILNNYITVKGAGHNFAIANIKGASAVVMDGLSVRGNTIRTENAGIKTVGPCEIIDNTIESVNSAISIGQQYGAVGAIIARNVMTALINYGTGIYVAGGSHDMQIKDNLFKLGPNVTTYDQCIRLADDGAQTQSAQIIGNRFAANRYGGIVVVNQSNETGYLAANNV